jgi:hypothetical protein
VSATAQRSFEFDIDYHRMAGEMIRSLRKLKLPVPAQAQLAKAITTVVPNDTMRGASTLTVTLIDPDLELTTGGFFDPNHDGRLDPIDVADPYTGQEWFRLATVDQEIGATGSILTLTFMERGASLLLDHRGPVKTNRAKKTRAEFFDLLCHKVRAYGGLSLVSHDEHVRQAIAKVQTPQHRRIAKNHGINADEKIVVTSWDGTKHTLTAGELYNAEQALDQATRDNAPKKAALALLEACIVEAPFFANPKGGDASSVGILQLLSMHLGGSTSTNGGRRDIALVVHLFLTKGFTGQGGAISLANKHPDWTAGRIAQTVQGSAFPARYERVRQGAEDVLSAYGGGEFGGTTYNKRYNFEIGMPGNRHETYWDGMTRLADEVDWAFFCHGSFVYTDPETELIKQKPAGVIALGDASVLDFRATVDDRRIATQATLTLAVLPFTYRAGEVLKLNGFGIASAASTAKLPGRWLIESWMPSGGDATSLATTFTLVQPRHQKKEPAPQTATRTDPTDVGAEADTAQTPKWIVDHVAIPIAQQLGFSDTPLSVQRANATHGPTQGGNASDHQGPPQSAWAADFGIGPDIRGGTNQAGAKKGDRLAKALAAKFGITWHGSGLATQISNDGRMRYQLIWRFDSAQAGNHYTHVHFGVRRLDTAAARPVTIDPRTGQAHGGTTNVGANFRAATIKQILLHPALYTAAQWTTANALHVQGKSDSTRIKPDGTQA